MGHQNHLMARLTAKKTVFRRVQMMKIVLQLHSVSKKIQVNSIILWGDNVFYIMEVVIIKLTILDVITIKKKTLVQDPGRRNLEIPVSVKLPLIKMMIVVKAARPIVIPVAQAHHAINAIVVFLKLAQTVKYVLQYVKITA